MVGISDNQFTAFIQNVDPYDFEQFIADLWEIQGWNATVTSSSNDSGVDVVATRTDPFDQKQLLQVKRYGSDNNVGGPEIQQYASIQHQEDRVDSVVVITTSDFTPSARSLAEDLNVKLIDLPQLLSLVNQYGSASLLQKYSDSATDLSEDSVDYRDTSQTTWSTYNSNNSRNSYSPDTKGPKDNIREKWSFELDGGVTTQPIATDRSVVVGCSQGKIHSVDPVAGEKKWVTSTDGPIESTPAVSNGTIYVGSVDGAIYAFDTSSGHRKWVVRTNGPVRSSPAVTDGIVYIGSDDGNFYALDKDTGEKNWVFDTGVAVDTAPAVNNDTVFITSCPFGDIPSSLYALNAETGNARWNIDANRNEKLTADMDGFSSPVVVDGVVYVQMYSLDESNESESGLFQQVLGSKSPDTVDVVESLLAFDSSDGTIEWRTQWGFEGPDALVDESSSISFGHHLPTIADDLVYFKPQRSRLTVLDSSNGDIEKKIGEDWMGHNLIIDDSDIYAPTTGMKVIDRSSGSEIWSHSEVFPTKGSLVDGLIVLGNTEGYLYVLEEVGKYTGG